MSEKTKETKASAKKSVGTKNESAELKAKIENLREDVGEVISILDPNGKRVLPSGSPGHVAEALGKLYAIIDGE